MISSKLSDLLAALTHQDAAPPHVPALVPLTDDRRPDLHSGASVSAAPVERATADGLASYPPVERWDDWAEYDPKAWPRKVTRRYTLVPTVCFNCESACGLLGYVDKETLKIQKFEGNPLHPGSRGRNCAKGPATLSRFRLCLSAAHLRDI